jgi:hypothetical protein
MAAAPDPQDELYPIAVLMDELKVRSAFRLPAHIRVDPAQGYTAALSQILVLRRDARSPR